jgi:hypothetical protein
MDLLPGLFSVALHTPRRPDAPDIHHRARLNEGAAKPAKRVESTGMATKHLFAMATQAARASAALPARKFQRKIRSPRSGKAM